MKAAPSPRPSTLGPSAQPSRTPSDPTIKAGALFGGRREVLIEHAGAQYRLRITQNNKLILTK